MTTLVLLPGMDGTGDLFAPLLERLSHRAARVVPLPPDGPQDPDTLAARLRAALPDGDMVLLAESFSGPIGARLALDPPAGLRGVVFVATFLTPPRPLAIRAARHLPLHLTTRARAWSLARPILLGPGADPAAAERVRRTVASLDGDLLDRRLRALERLRALGRPSRHRIPPPRSSLPALYLRGRADRLVPPSKAGEFRAAFDRLRVVDVAGPHFLLQAAPGLCAPHIDAFIDAVSPTEPMAASPPPPSCGSPPGAR